MKKVLVDFEERRTSQDLLLTVADEQEIVKKIGKLKANNHVNRNSATQLFKYCFYRRYYEIIDKLLKNGLELDLELLLPMFDSGDERLRQICIQHKVNFNKQDETILFTRTKTLWNNLDVFKQVVRKGLQWGMNLNTLMTVEWYGRSTIGSLLSLPLLDNRLDIVSFLLEQGADPNVIPMTLELLVTNQQMEAFKLVLPHLKEYVFRGTAYDQVKEPMIRILMENGMIEDSLVYEWGVHEEQVDVLTSLPPNPAVCQTLIYHARTKEMFDMLISKGATVDPDALLKLQCVPSIELVCELIDTYHASLDVKNESQQTPLALHLHRENFTVAQLIFEKGGKVDPEKVMSSLFDILDRPAFRSSIKQSDGELENWIKLLFDPKRINEPIQRQHRRYGHFLLIECVAKQFFMSLRTLLQLGADPNVCEINSNRNLVSPMFLLWDKNPSNISKGIHSYKNFPFMAWLVFYGSSVAGLPSTEFKRLELECEKWQYLYKKMQDLGICEVLIKQVFAYSELRKYLFRNSLESNPIDIAPVPDNGQKVDIFLMDDPEATRLSGLPQHIFYASGVIREMLESDQEEGVTATEIPITKFKAATMRNVIQFLTLYSARPEYKVISSFMWKQSIEGLFDMLKAGNLLEIPNLEYRIFREIKHRLKLVEDLDKLTQTLSMAMLTPKQRFQLRRESDWILPIITYV